MKILILFISLVLCFGFLEKPEVHQLSIKVEGIKEQKGNLGILLFNSKDGFPETGEKALKGYSVKVEGTSMVINLGKFPKGEYAITLMQDINMNGMMDKSMIGIPKEPFGFTVLQDIPFGAPSFEETSFLLTKNSVEPIKLMEI